MRLPEGATAELIPGEEERIQAAVEALVNDPHAPRQISVTVRLHVHHEYPKHVAGKIVNSEAEEEAAIAAAEPAEPAGDAPSAV